ncbi:unnamed protein product [Aphanomyces euteiches]|uniref:Uncharacterized protein n=1 Tax=Aphanomyces euteiches TaxID=100861 RepID=A0A6G0X218_9STRA|nr:hypothetical protein Ae201684_009399 [Aphanomyces euteiches]KAH9070003.1 hypothetical protein Ae201684P_002376 [Aphanomyces euteiches]KAH9116504.1 hypothetical protein AeMF1_009540 [Aphanomyces euteiches]KAH9156869.1 hypothetical protein AeRB84_001265 [Aphanomyces euteiches]KAH9184827.1 hypothetical protein AeNC1_013195 [Aphanomyces euteiches]
MLSSRNNYVIHTVSPDQLLWLRPAILKLWDFRPNSATPLTMEELMEWTKAREFAVALCLPYTSNNVDEMLESLAALGSSSCDLISIIGTVRHVTTYRATESSEMLTHLGCPPFLWDPNLHQHFGAVAQGYFHLPSKSFQPATLGQRLPRMVLGKDVLTYLSTPFVAAEAESTGVRNDLAYCKLAENLPHYCHTARLGHRIFVATTLYDHKTNGLNFASSFLQLVAKLARDIGVELRLGAAVSFNVVHWAVQSCWQEDATVVLACVDPADGFDIESSYMYTSPRSTTVSWRRSTASAPPVLAHKKNHQRGKWWQWPERVVKSVFSNKSHRPDRRADRASHM